MNIVILLLLIAALVCFGIAFIVPPQGRFVALGAAFITIVMIIGRLAVVLLFASMIVACAVNPVTGKREYVGPPFSAKACYVDKNGNRICVTGANTGIVLEGDFKKVK